MSQGKKVLLGSSILVMTTLTERLIGLISTLVLARILVPEDFGIVAIALLVLNLFDVLSLTGANQYITQKKDVEDEDLHSAWSMDILIRFSLAGLLIFSAPYIASYYDDMRLAPVIMAITGVLVMNSLVNPGLYLYIREQNYFPLFKLRLTQKLVTVTTTITLGVIFENYWALIIGHLASNVVRLCGSYIIHSFRPHFSTKKIKQQWQFSKWMLSKGVIGYCRSQMDTLLVSSYYSPSVVGSYHVMKYISTMPGSQVIEPSTQPLLATFSRSRDNPDKLNYQFNICLLVLCLIAVPMTLFIYTFHQPLVLVLLGGKWVEHSNVFGMLAMLTLTSSLAGVASQAIVAKRKVKLLFFYDVISLSGMLLVLLNAGDIPIIEFATLRVLIEFTFIILLLFYAAKYCLKTPLFNVVKNLIPGTAGALIAMNLSAYVPIDNFTPIIQLIIAFIVFTLIYCAASAVTLYALFGRSDEGKYIFELLQGAWKKIKGRLSKAQS